MDKRQDRTEERFTGGLKWLDTDPLDPAPPLLNGMREAIRKSLARMAALKHEQLIQPTDGIRVSTLRDVLRKERMVPLRDIAAPLIEWAPGEAAALRVPRADASAAVVAAAALRMADALMPHAALLRSAGVTKDHLRQIRQEARGLALVASQRRSSRSNRSRATRELKEEISKTLKKLGVIRGIFAIHSPDLLRQWDAVTAPKPPAGRPPKPRRRKRPKNPPPEAAD